MESTLVFSILFTIVIILSNVEAEKPAAPAGGGGGDITTLGAKPGADASAALLAAWKEACAAPSAGAVTVPAGTFLTGPVTFAGPCKGPITFTLTGTLQAPPKVESAGWITFEHVDKLTITGAGTLDGQGLPLYKGKPECFKSKSQCKTEGINLRLDFVNGGLVEAPGDSPNTDGIHVSRSKGVTITDVNIGTGDDCVSIGDGTTDLKVLNVKCGPGHGISVGSLGLYKDEDPITGVLVKGCTITKTDNGVRIKSWPDKYPSAATGIHFEDITMTDVENPILIDMMYCPSDNCNNAGSSPVKLTDISYKGIKGTTPTANAIALQCMPGCCTNIALADIDLKFNGPSGPPVANCTNIKPTITGTLNPAGCAA
ncbi:Pectin lyase-like superfamily protein [Euphorbia peplus]|nr:Pectin lyase-like superfamily protein [Euphorbia peplus]WCJ37464.1 Pectin lyase-like superfamily protein [Euphorbia peplus]